MHRLGLSEVRTLALALPHEGFGTIGSLLRLEVDLRGSDGVDGLIQHVSLVLLSSALELVLQTNLLQVISHPLIQPYLVLLVSHLLSLLPLLSLLNLLK